MWKNEVGSTLAGYPYWTYYLSSMYFDIIEDVDPPVYTGKNKQGHSSGVPLLECTPIRYA